MEKINFVNNTTPAVNATNLNKLQDNVEDLIKTEETTSDEDTYSCNYINNLVEDVYSTNEVKTNKVWIDGKPIYRKVIDLGTLPNANQKSVAHNISDLDVVVSLSGMTTGSNKFVIPEARAGTEYSDYQIGLWCNSTNVIVETGRDRTSTSAFAIIEYTKTSD